MGMNRLPFVLSLILAGCANDQAELIVNLRTDFVPNAEFTEARVTLTSLSDNDATQTHRVRFSDYTRGERVATFRSVAPGNYGLRVELLAANGLRIGERTQIGTVAAGIASSTLVLSRLCRGVSCPDGADPDATECSGGRCVSPECGPENPSACVAGCDEDGDCASAVSCAAGECTDEGACLLVSLAGACAPNEYCDTRNDCQPLPGIDGGVLLDSAVRDAGADAGRFDVGGPSDTGIIDAGIDASGPDCECARTGDRCEPNFCVASETCNAVTACPTGYECGGDECICTDVTLCGRSCTSDLGCNLPNQECDTLTNRCRRRRSCFLDFSCAAGEACILTDDHFSCLPYGDAAVGSECSNGGDCMSGRCLERVCAQRCTTNQQCGGGLRCEQLSGGLGCAASNDCDSSCTDEEACIRRCARVCETTSDCMAGEACRSQDWQLVGECVTASGCLPNELLETASTCFLHQTCWIDSPDCPIGYDCRIVRAADPGHRTLGHCARTL